MPKTITPAVSGIADNEYNKPVEIYDIYLDSETLHFAAHDENIAFYDPDGVEATYTALGLQRDVIKTSVDTQVDSVIVRLDNINRAMSTYLASNQFRGRKAVIRKIFMDISGTWNKDDDVYMFTGIMNKLSIGESVLEVEAVSRAGTFELEVPRRGYTLLCPWQFAASGCTDGNLTSSELLALTSGVADAGSTTSVVNDSARTEADDYWKYGQVEFTSGDNDGIERNVRASTKDTNFTLDVALTTAPSAGDTYEIKRGCDKTITSCSGLSNASAFGGFFTLPAEMVARA